MPGFEKEVEEMPAGKEKAHLEALLKKVKPKRRKTMQEQMQEHLAKMEAEAGQVRMLLAIISQARRSVCC